MARISKQAVKSLKSLFSTGEEAAEGAAPTLMKTEQMLEAGRQSPADPLATVQQAGTVVQSVDEARPAPAPWRTPERNINIDRLDTTEEVDKLLDAVSVSTDNAGYVPKSFDEMRAEGDLSDDSAILKRLINPKRDINKDGLLAGPQLKRARDIMVTSASGLAERSKDIAMRAARNEVGDMELIDFQRMVYRHIALQSAVQNEIRETARSLSFLRDISGPMNSLQLEQMMVKSGGGRDAILAKAKAIAAAGEGKVGEEAIRAVNKTVVDSLWMRTVKQVIGYRTVQLLSSPRTHVRNIVGNTITNVLAPLERGVGALWSQTVGSGDVQLGEMAQMFRADMQAFSDAWAMAGKTMKSKESQYGAPKVEEQVTFGDIPDESIKHGSVIMQGADYLSKALGLPGNLLLAEDEFFKTLAFRQQMQALAYRQAKNEGLNGAELTARIDDLMSGPNQEKILEKVRQGYIDESDPALMQEFMGRLKEEERIFYDMYKEAGDFAQYQTFTDPAVTRTGKAMEVVARNPLVKIIVPFYRTPANIFMYAMERSPLAPIAPQWRADMAAGGARRDMASARWALGSSTALFFGYLGWSGNVTGSGPANPELRNAYENAGWQPNSVRVGDTWVSIQGLDPFSTQLSVIANAFDAYRYATTDKQREHISMIIISSMMTSLKDRSFLEGVSGFIEAMKSGEKGSISHFISSLPASFMPFSSAMRTIAQATDKTKRSTIANSHWERALNEIQRIVPIWSSKLPPQVRPFGEDWVYNEPIGPDIASPFFTPSDVSEKNGDLAAEVGFNSVPIPRVYPIFSVPGTNIKIDALDLPHPKGPGFAYYDMQKLIGEQRANALRKLIDTKAYENLPDGPADDTDLMVTKGDKLKEAMQMGRQVGMRMFIAKNMDAIAELTAQGRDTVTFMPEAPKAVETLREQTQEGAKF